MEVMTGPHERKMVAAAAALCAKQLLDKYGNPENDDPTDAAIAMERIYDKMQHTAPTPVDDLPLPE